MMRLMRGRGWSMLAAMTTGVLLLSGLWTLCASLRPAVRLRTGGTLPDAIERPSSSSGHQVSVVGKIEEVVSPNAFILSDADGIVGIEILVVRPDMTRSTAAGQIIRVSGTLEPLAAGNDASWWAGELPASHRARWQQKGILVADVAHPVLR